jgi:hypothetical protein
MVFDDKELNDNQSFDMPGNDMMGDLSNDSFSSEQQAAEDSSAIPEQHEENEMDMTYLSIMAVIIVVMVYILYSMYTALVPVEQQEIKPVAQTQVEQPQATSVQTPPAPQQEPVIAAQPEPQQTASENAQEVAQMVSSDVSSQLQKQQAAINEIVDDTTYLENGQKELSTKFDKLSTKLDALLDQVETMIEEQKDRELKAKRLAEQKREMAAKKLAPPLKYYIRAVVEGRAWLQTDEGSEATVSVGQALKDYGTILAIYVNEGLVTTSSGRVISFKDNEY